MTHLSKSNIVDESIDSLGDGKAYIAITSDVQISVWPEFVDSKSSIIGDLYIWSYHVRIENRKNEPVKLISRYWRIIDEKGGVQEVNGEGVVGEQPIIAANSIYQYSSGVHLRHPSGIMMGKYQMKKVEGGEIFDVKIPTFSLDVPNLISVIN
jgi:ApaG protein